MAENDTQTDAITQVAGPVTAAPAEAADDGKRRGKSIIVWSVLSLVAIAAFGAPLWWLSGGRSTSAKVMACISDGSRESAGKCPPEGAPFVDGLVQKASAGTFTIQPMSGGVTPHELFVRVPDRPYIDVAHAQTHASLGQPVRVYYKKVAGKDAVIYMEDAPVLGMEQGQEQPGK